MEKEKDQNEDKIKDFMQKNWRIGILGGFIGGLIGKLTPDLIKVIVDILSKYLVGS